MYCTSSCESDSAAGNGSQEERGSPGTPGARSLKLMTGGACDVGFSKSSNSTRRTAFSLTKGKPLNVQPSNVLPMYESGVGSH